VSDAADGSAVVGEGSQADKGGDGLSGPVSEFGQVDQESTGDLRADADDGLEDVVFGFEGSGVGDDAVHAVFEILDLFCEEGDDFVDIAKDFGRRALSGMAVVFLGGEHADELAATVAQIAEFQDFLRRKRADDGGDDLTEMGEDAGIDGVGFGELSGAFGEVTDLSGVDDNGGQSGSEQGADGGLLIRARGFEDDPLGSEGLNPSEELLDAQGGVVEASLAAGGPGMSIKEIFADIDADEDAAQGRNLPNHKNDERGPTAFLFKLVNAGFFPSDYSNQGSPIPERTQLTPGPKKS